VGRAPNAKHTSVDMAITREGNKTLPTCQATVDVEFEPKLAQLLETNQMPVLVQLTKSRPRGTACDHDKASPQCYQLLNDIGTNW